VAITELVIGLVKLFTSDRAKTHLHRHTIRHHIGNKVSGNVGWVASGGGGSKGRIHSIWVVAGIDVAHRGPLLEIGHAVDDSGGVFRPGQRRQEHRCQHGNAANDDQQFNQCEGVLRVICLRNPAVRRVPASGFHGRFHNYLSRCIVQPFQS